MIAKCSFTHAATFFSFSYGLYRKLTSPLSLCFPKPTTIITMQIRLKTSLTITERGCPKACNNNGGASNCHSLRFQEELEFAQQRDDEEYESEDRHGNQIPRRQIPLERRLHHVVLTYIERPAYSCDVSPKVTDE